MTKIEIFICSNHQKKKKLLLFKKKKKSCKILILGKIRENNGKTNNKFGLEP